MYNPPNSVSREQFYKNWDTAFGKNGSSEIEKRNNGKTTPSLDLSPEAQMARYNAGKWRGKREVAPELLDELRDTATVTQIAAAEAKNAAKKLENAVTEAVKKTSEEKTKETEQKPNKEKTEKAEETVSTKTAETIKVWKNADKFGKVIRQGNPLNRAAADEWDMADSFGKVVEKGDLLDRMWKEGQLKKRNADGIEEKHPASETKQQPEIKTSPAEKASVKSSTATPEKPSKPKTAEELVQEYNDLAKRAQEIQKELAQMEQAQTKPAASKENGSNEKPGTETKEDQDSAEKKALAEEAEKKRKHEEECRIKLEAARNEGKKEGKEEGEKTGREKLLAEIKEKKNKNILRKGFNKIKDFVKRHKKILIAGAVGAAAVLTTWGISQAIGHFLPFIPIHLKDVFIKAGEIFYTK